MRRGATFVAAKHGFEASCLAPCSGAFAGASGGDNRANDPRGPDVDNGAAADDAIAGAHCFSVVHGGLFFRVTTFPSISCSAVRFSSGTVPTVCADGRVIHFWWSPYPAGGMKTQ